MKTFQSIVITVFAVLAVVGAGFFALQKGGAGSASAPRTTVWGVLPQTTFEETLSEAKISFLENVSYTQINSEDFNNSLVNALARGSGPDLILIPSGLVLQNKDFIHNIPHSSFSASEFKDVYLEVSEVFLSASSTAALPFSVDPIVMYWNRDLFSNVGLVSSPRYWDEFIDLNSRLTRVDDGNNIAQSMVAMGEFSNVNNAKEIISALIMQSGNPIIDQNNRVVLSENFGLSQHPTHSAVNFYVEFADPAKSVYSWNRSLPRSKDSFMNGTLAIYFGFSSEYDEIKERNPNLNFDIAMFPQIRNSTRNLTYGRLYGIAINRNSSNVGRSYQVAHVLTSNAMIRQWAMTSKHPPIRRDLIGHVNLTFPRSDLLHHSAVISRNWLDPNYESTQQVFQNMIESIISGNARVSEAVTRASNEINSLMR